MIVLTAEDIRGLSKRLRMEHECIEAKLKANWNNPGFSDHDFIALKSKSEGMLYATMVFLEALVNKEKGCQRINARSAGRARAGASAKRARRSRKV